MTCRNCAHYKVCEHFYETAGASLNRFVDGKTHCVFFEELRLPMCEYCSGIKGMYGEFTAEEPCENGTIVLQTDDITDFEFCPMCGRKL